MVMTITSFLIMVALATAFAFYKLWYHQMKHERNTIERDYDAVSESYRKLKEEYRLCSNELKELQSRKSL